MSSQLNVFYQNQKVGTIRSERSILTFEYSQHWINDFINHFPISRSLPLREGTYDQQSTLAFFGNLLPEGRILNLIEKDLRTEGVFKILERLGQECAGALVISPLEEIANSEVSDLLEIPLEEIYEALKKRSPLVDLAIQKQARMSLAGAQDKIAAIYNDNKVYIERGMAPTTHIIKPPAFDDEFRDLVYNEYFCMKLAKKIGFNVADVEIITGEFPLLVVTRFDRTRVSEKMIRLHQEDFCQAGGHLAGEKYESDGGPTISDNFKLIETSISSTLIGQSHESFLKWIMFNLLIGNCDSHSKNLSFSIKQGKYSLAPFYDLVCTKVYPRLSKSYAFSIDRKYKIEEMSKKRFEAEELRLGLRKGTFFTRGSEIISEINKAIPFIVEDIKKINPSETMSERIVEQIGKNERALKKIGSIKGI